jgi:hypothetical protein
MVVDHQDLAMVAAGVARETETGGDEGVTASMSRYRSSP